jgi:hypothetical protein
MRKHEDAATNGVDGKCIQDAFLFCGRNKESRVSAIEIVVEVNQERETRQLTPAVARGTAASFLTGGGGELFRSSVIVFFVSSSHARDELKSVFVRLVADIVPVISFPVEARWRPSTVDVRSVVTAGHVAIESKSAVQSQWH